MGNLLGSGRETRDEETEREREVAYQLNLVLGSWLCCCWSRMQSAFVWNVVICLHQPGVAPLGRLYPAATSLA
jgi:hypothetical protein